MKQAWVPLVAVLSLAACTGNDAAPDAAQTPTVDAAAADAALPDADPPDADIDAAPLGCDPLAAPGAQGCAQGMKCTWIQTQDTPDLLGELGCVPDGTVALGGACTRGAPGLATGYDDCVAGGICIGGSSSGVCKDLCGFDGSAAASCVLGQACTRAQGLGSDTVELGSCNPTCDPLTQTRIVNGQSQTCGNGQGCYLLASTVDTVAVCAGAGSVDFGQDIIGTTYANSCKPGLVPRQKVQGVTGNVCTALCKPADVFMGNNQAKEGGDPTFTNWLNKPATCDSVGGATVAPDVPTTGMSCQYYWTREPAANLTAFSNTLGWCFPVQSWKYDPDGMDPINNTDAYPRCINLTTGDVLPPFSTDPLMPQNDALYFGCLALPATKTLEGFLPPRSRPVPLAPVAPDRLSPYNR